jgi:hypothetical protein
MFIFRLILVVLLTTFFRLNVAAQEQTNSPFDYFNKLEYFNEVANRNSESGVFKLLQFNAPFRGGYYETKLSENGDVFSVRVTPFARQAGHGAKLDESQIKELKQTLSELISTNCLENLAPQDGEPYTALVFNKGKSFVRCNFIGEIPDALQKVKDFLNVEYDKADKKEMEEIEAKEKLARAKYGDWERNPQGIRASTGGTRNLENKNARLLYLKGKQQPVNENSKEIPLYYALVLYPEEGHIVGGGGGVNWSFEPISRNGFTWAIGQNSYKPEKELLVEYNVIDYTISVQNAVYQLKRGNLFIIKFDDDWNLQVTQLSNVLKEPASDQTILSIFGKKLGENLLLSQ